MVRVFVRLCVDAGSGQIDSACLRPEPIAIRPSPAGLLHVEVLHVERVVFDELPARLDLIAHERREHLVGFRVVLFADLKNAVVDAVVYDSPYVYWRVANDSALRAVGEPLNKLGYHIGIRKADTALLGRMRVAVKDFVASGERERIRRKWEGRH